MNSRQIAVRASIAAAAVAGFHPAGSWAQTTADVGPFAQNACVRCHEDLAGRLGEIVLVEWRNSVHFANGVGCEGCHGGDATLRAEQFPDAATFKAASHQSRDPRFLTMHRSSDEFVSRVRGREVSYFCGKCHAVVKEKHLGSPHGDYGDPTCLYCHARRADGHSTHMIVAATLDIIDTRGRSEGGRCATCHQAATMQAVGQIKDTLAKTAARVDLAAVQYEALKTRGYQSLELSGLQEHGREVRSRLRRVFHSFDLREINNFAGEIQVLADKIDRTHDMFDQVMRMRRRQTVVGLAVCTFLLGFAALLLYYKYAFCAHDATMLSDDRSVSSAPPEG
jgi:hypothetical protein